MPLNTKLSPEALKSTFAVVDFDENGKAAPHSIIVGQPRAQAALEFGVAMTAPGYNIFVLGEPGLGKLSMLVGHLAGLAQKLPSPPAYGYVDNFANPRMPLAITMPAGQGKPFCNDIENLLDNLLVTFPSVFDSPSYQQKKSALERDFNQAFDAAIDLVEKRARTLDVALFRENETITFAPVKYNKPLDEAEFAKLRETERAAFRRHLEELEEYLSEALLDLPQWRRAMAEKIRQLDSDTIQQAINPLFAALADKYRGVEDAQRYLSQIKNNLNNTITDLLAPARSAETAYSPSNYADKRLALIDLYVPTILVDHQENSGAPVIYEPHPTYQNLFGRIEYISDQGALVTSYRRICPGALHKANGGYLILDAEKLLAFPFVWDGVKRALQAGHIEIDSPYADLGVNTTTLKPENIPLTIKIILLGSADIYYQLEELDGEFNEIFKVLADFDDTIPLNNDSVQQFAGVMRHYAQDLGDTPLTNTAIQRLMEHSCRQAENQRQLSARIKDSLDIIAEAQLFSLQANSATIDKPHIEQALATREYRNGRLSQTVLEEMLDGTILIDTEGEAVGKINGLTVLEIGGSSFGAPARITVTVYPGSRGIVDIEREAELGQSIHSKGVMILTGYLGHCYAQQFPLAISASIAIEQSYGYIDGDSASLAELCCLISALTRTPIKQYIAVTGSINQYGEVQAIGGVNEKIEGFFRLCQARGLDGRHAVIIPAANKRNLMLQQDVIDAVAQDLFAIYAVGSVDATLELLTGKDVGSIDREGNYPEGSINHIAISRLKEISEMSEVGDEKAEGA